MNSRSEVPARENRLRLKFQNYVEYFDENSPFNHEQLEIHQSVIRERKILGNASNAIKDDKFLEALHKLLIKWGMNGRGAELVDIETFKGNIRSLYQEIIILESFK